MDGLIITFAILLAVIALIEIIFLVYPVYSYFCVLPVFANDSDFPMRIENIIQSGHTNIIFVNYSADSTQIEMCKKFIQNNPDSVIISHDELEKYFSETFAICNKM